MHIRWNNEQSETRRMWKKYNIYAKQSKAQNFFEKIKNKGPKILYFTLKLYTGPPNCTVGSPNLGVGGRAASALQYFGTLPSLLTKSVKFQAVLVDYKWPLRTPCARGTFFISTLASLAFTGGAFSLLFAAIFLIQIISASATNCYYMNFAPFMHNTTQSGKLLWNQLHRFNLGHVNKQNAKHSHENW